MNDDALGWRCDPGDMFDIRVTPKASMNRIKPERRPDGSWLIRVYVTVAAEDGKANDAVIKLLAKQLGITQSSLTIMHGLKDRNKRIRRG